MTPACVRGDGQSACGVWFSCRTQIWWRAALAVAHTPNAPSAPSVVLSACLSCTAGETEWPCGARVREASVGELQRRVAHAAERGGGRAPSTSTLRLQGAACAPVSPLLAATARHGCTHRQGTPARPPSRRRCRRPVPAGDVHSRQHSRRACFARSTCSGEASTHATVSSRSCFAGPVPMRSAARLVLRRRWRATWLAQSQAAEAACASRVALLSNDAVQHAATDPWRSFRQRRWQHSAPAAKDPRLCWNVRRAACSWLFATPVKWHSPSYARLGGQCGTTRGPGDLYFCGSCHVIMPADQGHDYFALLGAPRHFDVSQPALELAFKEAQKLLHPDKVSMRSEVRADGGVGANAPRVTGKVAPQ